MKDGLRVEEIGKTFHFYKKNLFNNVIKVEEVGFEPTLQESSVSQFSKLIP